MYSGDAAMLKVNSREYKVMLHHRMFDQRKTAVESFWDELSRFAEPFGVTCEDDFDETKHRTIAFLDTSDLTVRHNGFVLRQRVDVDDGDTEYTLKFRSPDRYAAAGAKVRARKRFKPEPKFEEDIAAPFRSRFSRSNTVEDSSGAPETLGAAAKLFPVLKTLKRDGARCPPSTRLQPVNAVRAHERVLKGPKLLIKDTKASVALILWSEGPKGRPLVAEFSFRYGDDNEKYSRKVASRAMEFFLAIQRLDWFRPNGLTKTQYVYRTA